MKPLITIIALLFCVSCTKNDKITSPFAGNWSGTYTGVNDNGAWTVNVSTDGKATGTATSSAISQAFMLSGVVDENGQFYATFGTDTSGVSFSGIMINTSASGTWSNNTSGTNNTGDFTGSKQ